LALTKQESIKPFGSHFRLNHSGRKDSRDHENGKTDKADLFGRTHRITLPQREPEPTSLDRTHHAMNRLLMRYLERLPPGGMHETELADGSKVR
jgi:hypothetical protein